MSGPNPRLEVRATDDTTRQWRPSEGVHLLREACLTLNATAPEVITSMTVVVGLDDLPVGPSSAVDLVQQIASEFGLAAEGQVVRYRFIARIHRLVPNGEATGRPGLNVVQPFQAISRWLGTGTSDRHDAGAAVTRRAEGDR